MSQFPHDEFVKEYIPELCQDYGIVSPSLDISSERREIDVFFRPTKPVPTTPETLGLMGRLAEKTCLFEVYRNPVTAEQIKQCLGKLFDVHNEEIKKAKPEKKSLNKEELPILWILSPTVSNHILAGFNTYSQEDWPKGIYFLAKNLQTGIVVIHQLPVTPETLWLRILGRGKVQTLAIEELKSLPKENYYRDQVLELVYGLLDKLERNQQESKKVVKDDEVLIMSLKTIFQEKMAQLKEEGKQEGKQEGIQQGKQEGIQQEINLVIRLLQRKIGPISPELEVTIRSLSINKIEDLGEDLLDFTSLPDLLNWLEKNS